LRVLVTGSSGFIGSAIADKLETNGCNVVRASRNTSEANNDNLIYLDLAKLESVSRLASYKPFDVIVHLGAKIGWNNESLEELYIPNVLSTGLIANLCMNTNALLIFSSAAIIHGVENEAITKESSLDPDSNYGQSKYLAEELIRISGARSCILRIGGVFGLNGPNHLGLNVSITEALDKISPILYGSGKAYRNYIYLWDVVSCVEYVINNSIEGVHLLAANEKISIKSMINEICKILGSGINPNMLNRVDVKNMLIEHSDKLPSTRTFQAALNDIKLRSGEI